MERPLLLPLLSIMAGLSAAGFWSLYLPPFVMLPLILLLFVAFWCRSRFPFLLCLSLLLALWSNLAIRPFLLPEFPRNHLVHFETDSPLIVEGIVDGRPQSKENGCKLVVQAEKICVREGYWPVTGKVLLSVGEGRVSFVSGDRVRFRSRLARPRNFLLPGAFDYERFLALRGIYLTATVRQQDDVILIRQRVASPVQSRIDRLAVAAGAFIDGAVTPSEGAVLRALLLGDQGGVPRSLVDAYSRSGVSHILSISGFHIGIISLVLFQLLYRIAARSAFLLLHCNLRRLILVFTLPVMVFYLLVTGVAPATARSVIMLGSFIVALAMERKTDPLDSLLLAAVVILMLDPPAFFDISFQLSFLALWGLLVLTPLFMKPFGDVRGGIRTVLLFLAASVGATAATAIPVAYHFHQVSLTGLLANFLIVPLLGYGAVVAGFAALPLIPLIPSAADALLTAASFLVWTADLLIVEFARLPVMTLLQPGGLEVGLFIMLAFVFTFMGNSRMGRVLCSLGVLLLVVSASLRYMDGEGKLRLWFLSVGQGESTLIRFPSGQTMLVDGGGMPEWHDMTGGDSSVGERLVAPTLRKLGVRKIDFLVLSHPHPDHLQGLLYIIRNFPVGEVWEGPGRSTTDDYLRFVGIARAMNTPVRHPQPHDPPIYVGTTRIEFPGAQMCGNDINDLSLVFRLTQGKCRVLFTGDIGRDAEGMLVDDVEGIRCTILKVPHHGSRYSNSERFLAAAHPEACIISVGHRNSFNLPAGETLERLRRRGIRIFRTDEDGTVLVTSDESGKWSVNGSRSPNTLTAPVLSVIQ